MATKAQVRFGRYTGKNVVVKDVQYLTSVIDASSGNVRNMELTPAGGIVRMQQDILSTSAEKTYNYASYVIGDLLYYGYVDCDGVAGGIVTYRIRVDAATTMWQAGAFNINNYCLYSPWGSSLFDDKRRTKTVRAIKTRLYPSNSSWDEENITEGMVIMGVVAKPNPDILYRGTARACLPVGMDIYIMGLPDFNNFFTELTKIETAKFSAYSRSIAFVTWAPVAITRFENLSLFKSNAITLYNPSDLSTPLKITATTFTTYRLTRINKNLGNEKMAIQIPAITIPSELNTAPARSANIYYSASCFGEFNFSLDMLPKDVKNIYAYVEFAFSGQSYRTTPAITYTDNTEEILYDLVVQGVLTGNVPTLCETDMTNYQTRRNIINANAGIGATTTIIKSVATIASNPVLGTMQAALDMSQQLINYKNAVDQIEWDKKYSGGTIRGTSGSALPRTIARTFLEISYFPYTDTTFQQVYNFPDYNMRNLYALYSTTPQIGFVQTQNCNIYRLGYPEEIAIQAENSFNCGIFVT